MFKEILLPIDLEPEVAGTSALAAALAVARAFQSRLHLVTVVPDRGFHFVAQYFPENYEEEALSAANERQHAWAHENVPEDIAVQHIVAHGVIYREIVRIADDVGADLIIMASHRPEMSDYLIGSNTDHVVRHARVPVLVIRG